MANYHSPLNTFFGVGNFLGNLKLPIDVTTNTPGEVYISGTEFHYIDADGIDRVIADSSQDHLGDVTGSHLESKVVALQGVPVDSSVPSAGSVLGFKLGMWRSTSASIPYYSTQFIKSDWAVAGSNYQIRRNHGLTWTGDVRPRAQVFDAETGFEYTIGSLDLEITTTEVILTVAPNATFIGSIHLVLPLITAQSLPPGFLLKSPSITLKSNKTAAPSGGSLSLVIQ